MNQIQFETSKVYGVFVKIDDFKEMKRAGMNLAGNFRIQYETTKGTVSTFTVDGIDENYKLQGFVSELTDEQKEDVIPNVDMTGYGKLFPNYLDDEGTLFMDVDPSFETLLTSLNVLLVNPLQDEWDEVCTWGHGSNITYAEYMEVGKNVGKWILLTFDK